MDLQSLRYDALLCTSSGVYDVRDRTALDKNTPVPGPEPRQIRSNIRRHLNRPRPKRMVTFKMSPCVVSPKPRVFPSSSSDDDQCGVVGVELPDRTLLDVSRYRLLAPLLCKQDEMTSSRSEDVRDVTAVESTRTSCELNDSGVGRTSDGSVKTDDSSELELFGAQRREHRSSCESMPSESESVFLSESVAHDIRSTSHNLPSASPDHPPMTPPRRTSSCSQQLHGNRNENGRVRTRRAVPRMGTRLDYRKLFEVPRSRLCFEPHYDEAPVEQRAFIEEGQYDPPWTSLDSNLGGQRLVIEEGQYDQPWTSLDSNLGGQHSVIEEGQYDQPWTSLDSNLGGNHNQSKYRSKPVAEEGFYEEPWGSFESNVMLDKYRIDSRQVRKQNTSDYTTSSSNRKSDNVNMTSSNQEKVCNYSVNQREMQTSVETSSSDETPSSAYSTGDSCCSTPLASPDQHTQADGSSELSQSCSFSSKTLCAADDNESHVSNLEELCLDIQSLDVDGTRQHRNSRESLDVSSGVSDGSGSCSGNSDNRLEAVDEGVDVSLQELYTRYADVMYTNRDNLEHTIRIQQSLFEQQLHRSNAHNSTPQPTPAMHGDAFPYRSILPCDSPSARLRLTDFENHPDILDGERLHSFGPPIQEDYLIGNSHIDQSIPDISAFTHRHHHPRAPKGGAQVCASPENVPQGDVQMEWVIKRRGDGTRYVTRRPVKKQLLRERALRVAEQRCGMTTDDDVRSELKVGRYWSKEERRKQLEQARSDRKERDLKVTEKLQRMETVGEGGVSGGNNNHQNIVEMSRRKMEHHKRKRGGALDDFLTVKEILAHGSQGAYKPLLSVTTV